MGKPMHIYIPRATKKYKRESEVKSKAKVLRPSLKKLMKHSSLELLAINRKISRPITRQKRFISVNIYKMFRKENLQELCNILGHSRLVPGCNRPFFVQI